MTDYTVYPAQVQGRRIKHPATFSNYIDAVMFAVKQPPNTRIYSKTDFGYKCHLVWKGAN